MTNINRRALLGVVPAAALIPACGLASPAVGMLSPSVAENPQLIALGAELPGVVQAYVDASAALITAWNEWSPKWPLAPDCCLEKWPRDEIERDLGGSALIRPGENGPRGLKTIYLFEITQAIALENLAKDARRKRSFGKAFVQRQKNYIAEADLGLQLLPAYHAECERIRESSRIGPIKEEQRRAGCDLVVFVRRILAEPSHTLEGLRIKAQAAASIGGMTKYDAVTSVMSTGIEQSQDMISMLGRAVLELA